MPEELGFVQKREYARDVSVQYITEDKTYKENELPDSFSGGFLVAEVVHRIFYVDLQGHMTIHYLEAEEAYDKEDKLSGLYTLKFKMVDADKPIISNLLEYEYEYELNVPDVPVEEASTVRTEITRVINENLPEPYKSNGDFMYAHYGIEAEEFLGGSLSISE